MKKSKQLYIALLVFTGILLVVIFVFGKRTPQKNYTFRERTGSIASSGEWLNTKQVIQGLLTAIESNPKDNTSKLKLAQAYIEEARITGDHGYYDNLILELLEDVLKADPNNFEALCGKATVLLSQHHFADAKVVAEQATKINSSSAFVYGLLCDANVELGKYDEAVKMADKMVSIKPDIRSYLRVSYLREIYGDYKGAIAVAKLAVSAGYPGLEQTAFARMILEHLYESNGNLDSAQYQCLYALSERPDYAFAIAGLGKIEKAKGNYTKAIEYFEKAKKIIIEYSFSDELTDLFKLNNQEEQSKKSAQEVIDMLKPGSNADESSSAHGHYADKELAYAYLKIDDTENAFKHAKLEYDRRPDNIDVCEAMAWVLYKQKKYAEANQFIEKALKTHSQNPNLLCRAGLIKINNGDAKTGEEFINKAFETNPFMDVFLKNEANKYIKSANK